MGFPEPCRARRPALFSLTKAILVRSQMVKAVAARRQVPRRHRRTVVTSGESPRELYLPGGLQRAVVKCSALAAGPQLNPSVGQGRHVP